MPHIVFAWTAPALLAGAKTVIRQPWTEKKARQFHVGSLATAYDRAPKQGGRPLALVCLTADPVHERLAAIPDTDYDAEGWRWLHAHGDRLTGHARASDYSWSAFEAWRSRPGTVWVVRFALLAVRTDPRRVGVLAPPEVTAMAGPPSAAIALPT